MTSESKGTFRVEEWNEESFSEVDNGPRLRRASVKKRYEGDIEGEGIVSYLFCYTGPETADIWGLERFSGRVDDMYGTFVMIHKGQFDNGIADMAWTISPKSGTDGLEHLEGEVHFKAGMHEAYDITLEHHLNQGLHLFKKLLK